MSHVVVNKDTSFTNFIVNIIKFSNIVYLPEAGDLKEAFFISLLYKNERVYFSSKTRTSFAEITSRDQDGTTKLLQSTGDPLAFQGTSPVNVFAEFYHAFLKNDKRLVSYEKGIRTEILHNGALNFDVSEKWAYSVFSMDVPAPKTEELPHVIRRNTVKPG